MTIKKQRILLARKLRKYGIPFVDSQLLAKRMLRGETGALEEYLDYSSLVVDKDEEMSPLPDYLRIYGSFEVVKKYYMKNGSIVDLYSEV